MFMEEVRDTMNRRKGIIIILGFIISVFLLYGSYISVNAEDEVKVTSDGFEYRVDQNNEITVCGFVGESSDIIIPSVIDGRKVVSVSYRDRIEHNLDYYCITNIVFNTWNVTFNYISSFIYIYYLSCI